MSRAYVTVEEARSMDGLRIAFTRGAPGPWSEACRCFFDLKAIPYVAVEQLAGEQNAQLAAWTGQNSAPVAMLDSERPRAHWSELLLLAERIEPQPRLIPTDEAERADMWGVAHEICGEDGFGWSMRILIFSIMKERDPGADIASMTSKYSAGETGDHARSRATAVLDMLAGRLGGGKQYLVGNSLTAADIYWTTLSNMVVPMSPDMCPMPDRLRLLYSTGGKALGVPIPDSLIAHRERILRMCFNLPMWF